MDTHSVNVITAGGEEENGALTGMNIDAVAERDR